MLNNILFLYYTLEKQMFFNNTEHSIIFHFYIIPWKKIDIFLITQNN